MGRVRALLIVLAVVGGGVALFVTRGEEDENRSLLPIEQAPSRQPAKGAPSLNTKRGRPIRRVTVNRPAPISEAERVRLERLGQLWDRALVLHRMQRHMQALALLETSLVTDDAFFAEPKRAKSLAAMRKGAASVLKAEDATEQLHDLVEELRRWGNLRPLDDPEKATALERQLRHAASVVARLPKKPQRALLMRHLERFLFARSRRSRDDDALDARTARSRLDIDALLNAVQGAEDARVDPTLPLPIEDSEIVESRRMLQLEALRVRGALTLLDALHAGLAWLALNQGEDGRFADGAGLARAGRLYEGDRDSLRICEKHLNAAHDRYAIATTALALMAFLDFRDQDGRGLFEPTIARAVAWLLKQQAEDGLFAKAQGQFYTDAMGLMALAQAAGATGDEALKAAVARGLETVYGLRGPQGGYRYRAKRPGDTSVTGWVTQAVEYAALAGIPVPEGMRDGLKTFLKGVRIGGERFSYMATTKHPTSRGNVSLYPAGMLMGRILWDEVPTADTKAWSTWLTKGSGRRAPWLYTLYYGVRMDVWIHGKLTTKWHGWLIDLARKQRTNGPVAGAFPNTTGRWTARGGTTLTTAFALLTMEHALFSR